MKRQWLLVLLLLTPVLVHAAAYGVDVVPVKNEIVRNESATYEVTIDNFQDVDARFQVYTLDPVWNVKTTPVNPTVPAYGSTTFMLTIRPTGDVRLGVQAISITFKDITTGSILRKEIVLNLRSGDILYGEYEPAVAMNVLMPYEVDPREDVALRLELRNRNALNITNLTVVIESEHFMTRFGMPLPPLSERTRDVAGLAINPLTAPGDAELTAKLYYNDRLINQLEKNFRIKEYTSVRERIEEERFFFKTVKTITVTNEGNVQNMAIVSIPTSLVKALFVNANMPYENVVQEDGRVLLWRIPLGPDESRSFTYTENYRIMILLGIVLVLGALAYLLLRSPLIVIKEAASVGRHDGVSRVKVRIFVRNRGATPLQDLRVSDKLPSLADVIKTEAPGSISPSKIAVSDKKGTLLQWELATLEPYEERVLTYHAKSKLRIIGRMSLPQARARFMSKGKERTVYSNNLEFVEKFSDK